MKKVTLLLEPRLSTRKPELCLRALTLFNDVLCYVYTKGKFPDPEGDSCYLLTWQESSANRKSIMTDVSSRTHRVVGHISPNSEGGINLDVHFFGSGRQKIPIAHLQMEISAECDVVFTEVWS